MTSKKKTVAIIDYKISNLFSVKNAIDNLGFNGIITSNIKEIRNADCAILPGVGSFKYAAKQIKETRLLGSIYDFIDSKKPFLGICLGFQLMFQTSDEFGLSNGLGIFEGKITHISNLGNIKIVPHVGWNKINIYEKKNNKFKLNIDGSFFYFVHSYVAIPKNKNEILTKTSLGEVNFCSSVQKDNVLATQFHPEKSGKIGLEMIRNFFSGEIYV